MGMQSVTLVPGVNTEKTLSANEAGVSISQLVRSKDNMLQSYGGWEPFSVATVPSTVRDLHIWQTLSATQYVGIGATNNLAVATVDSYTDITPTTRVSDVAPNVSISSANNVVTIVDSNASPSPSMTVSFETPIAIGNILLTGLYPLNTVISSISYTILSSVVPSTTIASSGILPVFQVFVDNNIVRTSACRITYVANLLLCDFLLRQWKLKTNTFAGTWSVCRTH